MVIQFSGDRGSRVAVKALRDVIKVVNRHDGEAGEIVRLSDGAATVTVEGHNYALSCARWAAECASDFHRVSVEVG